MRKNSSEIAEDYPLVTRAIASKIEECILLIQGQNFKIVFLVPLQALNRSYRHANSNGTCFTTSCRYLVQQPLVQHLYHRVEESIGCWMGWRRALYGKGMVFWGDVRGWPLVAPLAGVKPLL
jgi:hypothetical protein